MNGFNGRIPLAKIDSRPVVRVGLILMLLCAFTLMVSSAVRKSPTVDEQSHLFRGVAYLKTGATHFLLGHPLFGSTIAGLPVLTEPDLRLPVDEPYWEDGNWSLASDAFLWKENINPQRIIFLGRLSVMWLTLLLGVLLFRWGKELGNDLTGLFALGLLLFDPNILAHGRLVTNDLPLTLFFTLSVYGYWRWAKTGESRISYLMISGLGLGLGVATKFNAVLLMPIFGLLSLVLIRRGQSWKPLVSLLVVGIISWVIVWVVYGFALNPLPGGAFWKDLEWVVQYFNKSHGSYLAGEYSTNGWWYYFPITLFLKMPVPALIFLVWSFINFRNHQSDQNWRFAIWFLLMPSIVYFAFSLASSINIGYRYLLPILPFLYLFIAGSFTRKEIGTRAVSSWALISLTIWMLIVGVWTWPDYIPYFNLLVGGKGWRILSDSNVDWGQDLPALSRWQQELGKPINLSYFGTARPSAYGIDAYLLPTWVPAPEQTVPALQSFNPSDPAPGLYAISVTNLHGIILGEEKDTFAWFRDKTPMTRVGGSIFIYDVKPRGATADVAFSHLRPSEMKPELHKYLNTNDVRVRWIDAKTSFIWPENGGWIVIPSDQEIQQALISFWPEEPAIQLTDQTLYHLPSSPDIFGDKSEIILGNTATFLGYKRLETLPGEVTLMTAWRVLESTKQPLKIFVHALNEKGEIVGQWDGLDVLPISWFPGDVFVQFHRFGITSIMGADLDRKVVLTVGMYNGETLVRLSGNIVLED